jgi:hypothetical protein
MAFVLALLVGVGVLTTALPALQNSPPATERPTTQAMRIQGEACTESCRRDHSACMIEAKGSPNCNVRLQQCLQRCLAGKKR